MCCEGRELVAEQVQLDARQGQEPGDQVVLSRVTHAHQGYAQSRIRIHYLEPIIQNPIIMPQPDLEKGPSRRIQLGWAA